MSLAELSNTATGNTFQMDDSGSQQEQHSLATPHNVVISETSLANTPVMSPHPAPISSPAPFTPPQSSPIYHVSHATHYNQTSYSSSTTTFYDHAASQYPQGPTYYDYPQQGPSLPNVYYNHPNSQPPPPPPPPPPPLLPAVTTTPSVGISLGPGIGLGMSMPPGVYHQQPQQPVPPMATPTNPNQTTLNDDVVNGAMNYGYGQQIVINGNNATGGGFFTNQGIVGSENHGLIDFLKNWVALASMDSQFLRCRDNRPPIPSQVAALEDNKLRQVSYHDLAGDECDIQGIDWIKMGVTRKSARERRDKDYVVYGNLERAYSPSMNEPYPILPRYDTHFKFDKMTVRRNVRLSHFQLRSLLACPSRTYAFYPGPRGIHRINTVSGTTDVGMDLSDMPTLQVSSIDANYGILVAGTFQGEYCLKNLDSPDNKYSEGQITSAISGITNHIQIHTTRSGSPASPVIAFASNDLTMRIFDVASQKFISKATYAEPINCSSLSPDNRMRIMVGDSRDALVTNAETGEIIHRLRDAHRDFGFACDWSDDGWTVATACQGTSGIKIWDARRWCDRNGTAMPICAIRTEMSSARGLRFSPTGSGKRVLVAAEEADFINVIDAQTLASKQTFDIFGEIGGVAFTNEGQTLNILSCDGTRGGLLQFNRCGLGSDPMAYLAAVPTQCQVPPLPLLGREGPSYAWRRLARLAEKERITMTEHYRQRAAMSDLLEPF